MSEAACLRCYLWGDNLDLGKVGVALADALVAQGFGGGDDDDTVKSLIVAVPETLPLGDEAALMEEINCLGSGLIIIPGESEAAGDE